jgi:hypothetical protein
LNRAISRLLRGDPGKRSRLHDLQGNFPGPGALAYLPACIVSTLARKITGAHPKLPWLGYRAIRRLDRLIRPDWAVLEFGSGASSAWFAARCSRLVTIEGNPLWFEQVRRQLAPMANASILLHSPPYGELRSALPAGFDLVVVDGESRDEAMRIALEKVRPDGYVYLDNSDVAYPSHVAARELLTKAATSSELFVDLTPGNVSVTQGMLARVPATGARQEP